MRISTIGLFAVIASACAAEARAAAGDELVFLNTPKWLSAPSADQAAAAYPAGRDRAGEVSLLCELKSDGGLKNCETQSEAPQGMGFARAAKSLTPLFKVDLSTLAGTKLSRVLITVPVRFPAPAERAAPQAAADPDWIGSPPAQALSSAFPAKAAQAGAATGRAVLECTADRHGLMTACQVISETPPDLDFGLAATHVAALMAVNPWTADGRPAEGERVKFAVRLNRDEAAEATPKPQ
jgi:hypothetical protein